MRYIQSQIQHSVGTVEEYRQYERRTFVQAPVEFDKTLPNIDGVLSGILPTARTEDVERLKSEINTVFEVIDWHLKDSAISGLRRSLTKVLSGMLSAVEAKSKANEIVDKLLR
jgi:hypothetical protein